MSFIIFILNKAIHHHSSLISCCFSSSSREKTTGNCSVSHNLLHFSKNKTTPKKYETLEQSSENSFLTVWKLQRNYIYCIHFFFNVHSSIDDVAIKKRCDPSAVHTLCLLVQRSKLCTVHYCVIQTYTMMWWNRKHFTLTSPVRVCWDIIQYKHSMNGSYHTMLKIYADISIYLHESTTYNSPCVT